MHIQLGWLVLALHLAFLTAQIVLLVRIESPFFDGLLVSIFRLAGFLAAGAEITWLLAYLLFVQVLSFGFNLFTAPIVYWGVVQLGVAFLGLLALYLVRVQKPQLKERAMREPSKLSLFV